jgi:superoxide reductase
MSSSTTIHWRIKGDSMNSRREFIKSGVAVCAGVALGANHTAQAAGGAFTKGLVYTAENPGMWEKKVKSHAPVVEVKDGKVTVTTNHGMSEKHYIVRHTLVGPDGDVLGDKTFSPHDENAVSRFDLPSHKGKLLATSFCNKHDLWVTEFSL